MGKHRRDPGIGWGECTADAVGVWLMDRLGAKRPTMTIGEIRSETPAQWSAPDIEHALCALLRTGAVAVCGGRFWVRQSAMAEALLTRAELYEVTA